MLEKVEELKPANSEHIIDGEFKSDKYPVCPKGLIPFKLTDPMAQDLLWEYASRRAEGDIQFSHDLQALLIYEGYKPPFQMIDEKELTALTKEQVSNLIDKGVINLLRLLAHKLSLKE